MGAWSSVTGMTLPRPALSNAQKDVDQSKELDAAAERGVQIIMKKRR